MSVRKYLDLSTGHLPVKDRKLLDSLPSYQMPLGVVDSYYGWNIWLLDNSSMDGVIKKLEHDLGFTDALSRVLRRAMHHDCKMVNLDRDADRIDGLEYFDE